MNLQPMDAMLMQLDIACPDEMPALAMLYSPWQEWGEVFCPEDGLRHGTIFPPLAQPFLEGACHCV